MTPPPHSNKDTADIFVPRVGLLRNVATSRLRPNPPPSASSSTPTSSKRGDASAGKSKAKGSLGLAVTSAPPSIPPLSLFQAEIYVVLGGFEHTVLLPGGGGDDDSSLMTVGWLKPQRRG